MPFHLSLRTREITEITENPKEPWYCVIYNVARVTEGGLGPEYTPASIRGLYKDSCVIVQSRDDAWDIEYWTRGSTNIKTEPGPPCPVIF